MANDIADADGLCMAYHPRDYWCEKSGCYPVDQNCVRVDEFADAPLPTDTPIYERALLEYTKKQWKLTFERLEAQQKDFDDLKKALGCDID